MGWRGHTGAVLFPQQTWAGLADGSVTVALRRWKRPTVRAGGTLQTPGGLLRIDALDVVDEADVTEADAHAAGHADRDQALAGLRPEGTLCRIRFHRIGDDPRLALRARADLDDDERADLVRRLARLDWALPTLELIGRRPGVVSTELAPELGLERLPFKARVRRLKALGLTESLAVGYRLSPRGQALLAAISRG